MEYNKDKKEIISKRRLSKLDELVLEFTIILKKYFDYVIISGYVSIVLGRSRATEDIDIYIKSIPKNEFNLFYKEVKENGFWCLNAESADELFDSLEKHVPIRFAKINTTIPNFELKYPKDELDKATFEDSLTLVLEKEKLIISSLERQIAFKRYYLKSYKDVEDAIHLEEIFKNKLDYTKINKLKKLIEKR